MNGGASPIRVQLSRAKGWRMPANTVSVARPGPWGNPYPVDEARQYLIEEGDNARDPQQLSVEWFRTWVTGTGTGGRYYPPTPARIRDKLAGKNLACWCPLDRPCHADVLLELANLPTVQSTTLDGTP